MEGVAPAAGRNPAACSRPDLAPGHRPAGPPQGIVYGEAGRGESDDPVAAVLQSCRSALDASFRYRQSEHRTAAAAVATSGQTCKASTAVLRGAGRGTTNACGGYSWAHTWNKALHKKKKMLGISLSCVALASSRVQGTLI